MQRSDGGGSFEAVDMLNGKLLCGCEDVHACVVTGKVIFFVGSMHGPISWPLVLALK